MEREREREREREKIHRTPNSIRVSKISQFGKKEAF